MEIYLHRMNKKKLCRAPERKGISTKGIKPDLEVYFKELIAGKLEVITQLILERESPVLQIYTHKHPLKAFVPYIGLSNNEIKYLISMQVIFIQTLPMWVRVEVRQNKIRTSVYHPD